MEPPRGRRDAAHSGGHCPRCQKRLVRPAVLEVELRELLMRIEHLRTLPHWLPLRPYFKNTRCHSNSKHDCVPDWNIEILECDKDCSFVKVKGFACCVYILSRSCPCRPVAGCSPVTLHTFCSVGR